MSLSHRELKNLRALRQKKDRLTQQCILIEGLRLVREALFSGAQVEQVFVTDRFAAGASWPSLEAEAKKRNATIVPLSEKQADQIRDTQHPQGIFATVAIPAVFTRPYPPVTPPVLILDGISDPGNLGTLLRTAEWFGVQTVLANETSADIYNPKVVRGGMGAHFHLPQIWQGNSPAIAQALEPLDITLLGATLDGKDLHQLPPMNRWALVIGSEAHGLCEFWTNRLDFALTIPGSGSGESLNAAVAAGIILQYLHWVALNTG